MILYFAKPKMMTVSQGLFQFFCTHLTFITKGVQFAHKFLVALTLAGTFKFFRLYQMFCQPLTVA